MGQLSPSSQDGRLQQPSAQIPAVIEPSRYVSPDDDDSIDLLEIWRIINKYRNTIVLFAAIVVITVVAATLIMLPSYKATTVLELSPQSRSMVRFQNVEQVDYDTRTYQRTQAQIIRSRAVAEAVIERLNLADEPAFNGEMRQRDLRAGMQQIYGITVAPLIAATKDWLSGGAAQSAQRDASALNDHDATDLQMERLVGRLRNNLSVVPIRDSNLFEISFESYSPVLSAAVANAVASEYLRLIGERRFSATTGAKAFLDREIADAQARLESSERDLNRFARANQVVDLEDRNNIISSRLTELNTNLSRVKGERIAAEALYRQAQDIDVNNLPTVLHNDLVAMLKENYTQLRIEYAQMAQTFTPSYPDMRSLQEQIDTVRSRLNDELQNIRSGLQLSYQGLLAQETMLEAAVDQQKAQLLDLQDRSIQYNILKREWETNRELYSGLLERVKEISVAAGMELDNASIIDAAAVPRGPFKPSLTRNTAVAGVLGLMGGFGVAFLLAFLDNTVRTPEEIERLVHLPSLGLLPLVNEKTLPENVQLDLLTEQMRDKDLSEAFRSIRTSLMFATPGGTPKTLMVTSASQGEGKSMSVINLGIVLAQTGATVLLIDADLRRPRLHKAFRRPRGSGLTDYLVNSKLDSIYDTGIEHLSVLTSGTPPPNPAELLSAPVMDSLLEGLAERYDYIIVDSPPVLGLADPVVLSTKVQGVVLVCAAGYASKNAVREAVKRLRSVQAPLVGVVLNRIEPDSSEYGYYNRYYYNYRDDSPQKRRKQPSEAFDAPYSA